MTSVNHIRGGGIVKIDALENNQREVVKYSIAYINHQIFAEDNGRVFGYDNSHNYHHRHYLGEKLIVVDHDRLMQRMDRHLFSVQCFHCSMASAELSIRAGASSRILRPIIYAQ